MLKLRGVQHVHVESAIWTVWETGWQGHYKEGAKLGRNAYYYTFYAVLTSSQNAAKICFSEMLKCWMKMNFH